MTLTEFLLARIAEDEAAAASYRGAAAAHWKYGGRAGSIWIDSESACRIVDDPDLGNNAGQHIARWDPARVLAECAVKKRIIDNHEQAWDQVRPSGRKSLWGRHTWGGLSLALRCLALPYTSHPDYQQEWAL